MSAHASEKQIDVRAICGGMQRGRRWQYPGNAERERTWHCPACLRHAQSLDDHPSRRQRGKTWHAFNRGLVLLGNVANASVSYRKLRGVVQHLRDNRLKRLARERWLGFTSNFRSIALY
jgi:hypothetical protein